MGICPILSGYKIVDVNGNDEIKIFEIECIKERCNFFCSEEGVCVFLNIGEIKALKKGVQALKSSIHDELYDLKYDISDKIEKMKNVISQNIGELSNIPKIIEIIESFIKKLEEIQNSIPNADKINTKFSEYTGIINQNLLSIAENIKLLPDIKDGITNNISFLSEKFNILSELKNSLNEMIDNNKNLSLVIPEKLDNHSKNLIELINEVKNVMIEFYNKVDLIRENLTENNKNAERNTTAIIEKFNSFSEELSKLNNLTSQSFKENIESLKNEFTKLAESFNVYIFPVLSEIKERNLEDFEKIILKVEGMNEQISNMSNSLKAFGEKTNEFSETIFSFINEIKNDFQGIKKSEELRIAEELNDQGVLEFYSGNVDLAISKFNNALQIVEKPEIIFNLASALSYKGEKEKAEEILIKLIGEFPEFSSSFYELGMITFDKGKVEEAIELMKQGLEKEPRNQFLLANIGYAYEKINDIENALKYWKKALDLDSSLFEVRDSINFYTERRV